MIDKVRIYEMARDLNVDSKVLIDAGARIGIRLKNQLSSISHEEKAALLKEVVGQVVPPVREAHGGVFRPLPLTVSKEQAAPAHISTTIRTAIPTTVVERQKQIAKLPGVSKLLDIGERAGLEKLSLIALLAEVDPESAMFKVRKTAERLCRRLLGRVEGKANFKDMIDELGSAKTLSPKAVRYLHLIRENANEAVHEFIDIVEEEYSLSDIDANANSLACVLEEAIRKSLLGKST